MRIAVTAVCLMLAGCGTVPHESLPAPRQVQRVASAVRDAVRSGCTRAADSWLAECRNLNLARFGAMQGFDVVETEVTPRGLVLYAHVVFADRTDTPAVLTIDCGLHQGVLTPEKLSMAFPGRRWDPRTDPPMPVRPPPIRRPVAS